MTNLDESFFATFNNLTTFFDGSETVYVKHLDGYLAANVDPFSTDTWPGCGHNNPPTHDCSPFYALCFVNQVIALQTI